MTEKQLVYLKRTNIDAATALREFAKLPLPEDAANKSRVALLYSPTACRLCLIDDSGIPSEEQDSNLSPDDVYELRAFQADFELRWLHEPGQEPRAVIVGESEPSCLSFVEHSEPVAVGNWLRENRSYLEVLSQQYLLWGTAVDPSSNSSWSRLKEARIVALNVPIGGLNDGDRVALHFHEYLADGDEDGNVVVMDQRLSHLAPAK